MKKLIFIVACMSPCKANAWQVDTTKMYDLSKRIFIEPLALIDVYNEPSLRLGIEWPLIKNFCSIFGVWGQYQFVSLSQTYPYFGQYVKLGFRLYPSTLFRKKSIEKTMYLSAHIFYKSQKFLADDNIREYPGGGPGQAITYDVSKKSEGFHIEIGTQYARGHLCFEPYIGAGVRQSTVINSATDSLLSLLYHFHEGTATHIGNSSKTNAVLPSITLGVRLSYLFKTRRNTPTGPKTYSAIKRRLPKP